MALEIASAVALTLDVLAVVVCLAFLVATGDGTWATTALAPFVAGLMLWVTL